MRVEFILLKDGETLIHIQIDASNELTSGVSPIRIGRWVFDQYLNRLVGEKKAKKEAEGGGVP